ncbi:MAG: TonB-dependent siderophore receptor [Waterburya sp.]
MNWVKYRFFLFQLSLLPLLITINPVVAESDWQSQRGAHRSNLTAAKPVQDIPPRHQVSISATDLLAQSNLTRVTGIEVNQTKSGLEVILKTATGGERLVPLILPEGNNLMIDILDATLSFSIRNGVTKTNPVAGIKSVALTKVDESSIRLIIAGKKQAPSAEVVPGRNNLVLNVTPEKATAQQRSDEEIEVIATGEAADNDDYFVPDAGVTRTDTPIIDTPASVQVIPRQVFQDQGAKKFSDALSSAGGVATSSTSRQFFNNPVIRGFDASSVFLRNGIPEAFNILQPPKDLSNVERLEILSGPASVVGGQISPGGIINVVTKQPLSSPFYELSASYGSFNTYEGAFDISGPLNESKTLGYRLNASIYHSDSVFDVDNVDNERVAIAPVISWQIDKNTKLSFEGLYLGSRFPQRTGLPAVGTIFDNPNGEVPRDQFLGEPNFDQDNREFSQIGYDLEHKFSDNWSLRHAFRYSNLQVDQKEAFITVLQDDLRTLERTADQSFTDINNYQTTAYLTGEFKTGGINHQLLAGIDYVFEEETFELNSREIDSTIDLFEPIYTGVGEIIPDSQGKSGSDNDGLGFYLQDQLKVLNDRLILVLGGRLDFVSFSNEDLLDESIPEESQDNHAFSPTVGVLYKVAKNVSLYSSYSRSFEQDTGRSRTNEIFEPSRSNQYEIGVKADWLDSKFSTTLAWYDLTKSNVLTIDPEDSEFQIQTGEQSSQGIELQTTGEITPDWNVIASYTYTDAKITQDNQFAVGNRLQYVPENAASLSTTYTIPQGNLQGLGFGFGLFYVGEREGDLDNSFQVPDYLRTDAALFYRQENLNLALNFQNLFDIDYFETADDDLKVYPADPLTIEFSASYKF